MPPTKFHNVSSLQVPLTSLGWSVNAPPPGARCLSFGNSPPIAQVNPLKKMAAGRAAQSTMKRWLGDAGTYPVLATCVLATALCSYQCGRYLIGHPDVTWNKNKRMENGMYRYDSAYGEQWQSHRRWFATIKKNQINEAKGL